MRMFLVKKSVVGHQEQWQSFALAPAKQVLGFDAICDASVHDPARLKG